MGRDNRDLQKKQKEEGTCSNYSPGLAQDN